jgi:feruloyl esterase
MTTSTVNNYTGTVDPTNGFAANVTGLDFCNVTVTYTHPGQNDTINVFVLLPSNWTGRFQGVGGGGWTTGTPNDLIGPASQGYAAASTDGGHSDTASSASGWAQVSPGNVNFNLLNDFASVSLNDMTIIGKQITESYYGQRINFSYWNGCSTGGRQGLMQAQRYPQNYDGILAAAPAINWAQFVVAEYWPQFFMNQLGYFPSPCELNGISTAAITACDGLDGVIDGIISRPDLCSFNASSAVGQEVTCPDNSTLTVTAIGAKVAEAIWTGPFSSSGKHLWYGLIPGSSFEGLAVTVCPEGSNTNCTGSPFYISTEWMSLFVTRNASLDASALTLEQYSNIFHASVDQFTSVIGTNDPDLTEFKTAGGKMITWHGLADQLIFPDGSIDYYSRVENLDPSVRDYYRLFAAPGVMHCGGGLGAFPGFALDQLVQWVEGGAAPGTLQAVGTAANGAMSNLALCLWPLVSAYHGGNTSVASSYSCVER